MARTEKQDPKTGEITTTGQVGPEKEQQPPLDAVTPGCEPSPPEIKTSTPKLMDKLFDMIIGVLSLKVKSIRVHQAITVNGHAKSGISITDKQMAGIKMMLTPFGVMLISKQYSGEPGEMKRLISFNNCYEIEFLN